LPPSTTAWVLTDGKAGDTAICFGVVEALGLEPVLHKIAPRVPWSWATPYGRARRPPGREARSLRLSPISWSHRDGAPSRMCAASAPKPKGQPSRPS